MVRLSFAFLSVAALAVASAAPFFDQYLFESGDRSNKCIREMNIKEYQLFELESYALKSLVSRELTDNLLVGGVNGNKNLQQLQFCVVSTDKECSTTTLQTDCLRENVEYRFRVNGPIQGYLHIDGPVVRIVKDYYQASGLSLYKESGWGLRISHQNYDGTLSVFATTQPGAPIRMEAPQTNNVHQWFEFLEIYSIDEMVEYESNKCLPETNIKEYQSFKLLSYDLDSYVSKPMNKPILVGGDRHDRMLDELEFCIVGSEGECNPSKNTKCIYQNVQYRIRVFGPLKGYLRVKNDMVIIVPDFHDASPMNLYKETGYGLRIEHMSSDRTRLVLATHGRGEPLTLEQPQKKKDRQWFDFERSSGINNEIESLEPNQCVPETTIREYHPFLLKSSNLNTYVSKEREEDTLVGGVANNKNFQQLELCIASSDYGCSTDIQSACIYRNVDYRFRVNGPVRGYLHIDGDQIKIVDNFKDASRLNLYKEAGWGLRIVHVKHDGSRIAFAAKKQGQPITMEEPVTNASRQWFEIIEVDSNENSLW